MKVKVGDLVRDKNNGCIGFVYQSCTPDSEPMSDAPEDDAAWIFWSDDPEPGLYWLDSLLNFVDIL